jgi:hypothetical protein
MANVVAVQKPAVLQHFLGRQTELSQTLGNLFLYFAIRLARA